MTVVNSKIFSSNPVHYLNLAVNEHVIVKRGKRMFQITSKPQFENPSPSGDPYFANPGNVAELERRVEEIKEGNVKFTVLTPERQKEMLGLQPISARSYRRRKSLWTRNTRRGGGDIE